MASMWDSFDAAPKGPAAPSGGASGDMWSEFDAKQPGDLARGFKTAWQQLPQLGYGLAAIAASAVETAAGRGGLATAAKDWSVGKYKEWGDAISAQAHDTDEFNVAYDRAKEGDFGALVDWLQYGVGYSVSQLIQVAGTAGVGAVIGKAALRPAVEKLAGGLVEREAAKLIAEGVAKDVAQKQAVASIAAQAGALGATGAQAFGMEGGEIGGDLAQRSVAEGRALTGAELARAAGATGVAGLFEFAGDALGLGALLGKAPVGKTIASMTGLKGRATRGIVAGAMLAPPEGLTEYMQTGAEEYGKGNEASMLPWKQSEESQRQALNAGALGALGGAVMGAGGGVITGPKAPDEPPKDPESFDRNLGDAKAVDAIDGAQSIDEALAVANVAAAEPVSSFTSLLKEGDVGGIVGSAMRRDKENAAYTQLEAQKQRDLDALQTVARESPLPPEDGPEGLQTPFTAPAATAPEKTAMQIAFERDTLRKMEALAAKTTAVPPEEQPATTAPLEPIVDHPVVEPETPAAQAEAPPVPDTSAEPKSDGLGDEDLSKIFDDAASEVQAETPAGDGVPVDDAAHAAATSTENDLHQPTEAQKEAGNYQKGHLNIGGLAISVENPAGSKRRPEWPTLAHHYGYLKGTVGFDKDHVDVFVKPKTSDNWKGTVYVVNQNKESGGFDEHKAMVGYGSQAEARAAYLENYTKGWEKNIQSIVPMPSTLFKRWAEDPSNKGPKGGVLKSAEDHAREASEKRRAATAAVKSKDGELPNENGVYDEDGKGVTKLKFSDKRTEAHVNVLQLENGKWIAGYGFQHSAGDFEGLGTPLASGGAFQFDRKDDAIGFALGIIGKKNQAIVDAPESGSRNEKQVEDAKKILAWVASGGGEPTKPIARGVVGGKLAAGEIVTTATGRSTTPFPNIDVSSDRKATNTLSRVDSWLHANAIAEAESRGDKFNLASFRAENPARLPQASKDAMEEYLFGDRQPPVLPSILKPLYTQNSQETTDTNPEPTPLQKEIDKAKSESKSSKAAKGTDEKDAAKKAVSAAREAERSFHALLSADSDLFGVVNGGPNDLVTIKQRLAAVYGSQVKAAAEAGDTLRSKALETAFKKLENDEELFKSVQKSIVKAQKLAEKEKNRDPVVYQSALTGAMEEDNIEGEANTAAFKGGWDHALAGKTKSTLSGDLVNVLQHGYEAARKWMKTTEGRAWYEGKRGKKLENTGADLRRWFDDAKAGVDALRGEAGKAWRELSKLTERATLFRDLAGEGATPGTERYFDHVRSATTTFKEFVKKELALYSHRRKQGLDEQIDSFIKGETRSDKYPTDEIRREALKSLANKYLSILQPLLDDLRGAKTVADAADRYAKVMGAKDESGQFAFSSVEGKALRDGMLDYSRTRDFLPGSYLTKTLAISENAPSNVTRAKPLTPPRLDRVERKGLKDHRGGKDITPAEFKKEFGFADVGFGGYVAAKADQDHLNYAYDAFVDFADELGIPHKMIGFNGRMHFTIGALGHGKFAAHYSPNQPAEKGGTVQVINLTNTQGDGTVAHEWFHALDYNLGGESLRPTTDPAIQAIVRALKMSYDLAYPEKRMNDFLFGGWYYKGSKNDKIGNAKRILRMMADSGQTNYFKEAQELGKDYWGNDREIFARAGEAFMWDRLGEKQNTYLVNPWVADGVTKKPAYRGTPYPEGDERKRFAEYFTALFKAIDWSGERPVVKMDRFTAVAPKEAAEFRAKAADLERNIEEIYADHQKNKDIEKRAREIAEKARILAEQQKAAEAATPDVPPAGELNDDELDSLFDQASAELRESTQEEPDAPAPGDAALEDSAPLVAGRDFGAEWNAMGYGPRQELATPLYPNQRPVVHRISGSRWEDLSDGEQEGMRAAIENAEKVKNLLSGRGGRLETNDEGVGRVAAKMAAEAAKLGVEGIGESMSALVKLFGGGKIQSFPGGLDEEAYKAAKPHFQAALEKFQAAGKTLKDLFKFLIQQFGEGIKPYALRFAKESNLSAQLAPPSSPSIEVARWIEGKLGDGDEISWKDLFARADMAWGGTQAEGKYAVKDAYDAVEAGVNLYLRRGNWAGNAQDAATAQRDIRNLQRMTENLPTQTKRTAEMDEFQQFSTPPAYAYAVNWAANVKPTDTVLEPSAGIGGLAIFAHNAGATVVLNELSQRRAAVLKSLFPDSRVFTEDASQINNILPDDVSPTVVVMNPPFSATAGRKEGSRDTMEGAKHIEQALARLAPGGRLVAIVGEGMAADRPAFKKWWKDIAQDYNVRANIGIDGKGYAKYGTTFSNQILVIDNNGPTKGAIVTGKVDDVAEVPALLERIRNERPESVSAAPTNDQSGQSDANQQGGGETATPGLGQRDEPRGTGTPAVGDGSGNDRPELPARTGEPEGDAGQTDTGRPAGRNDVPDGKRRGGRGAGAGGSERSGPGDSGAGVGTGVDRQDGGNSGVNVEKADEVKPEGELTESIFEQYQPQRLKIAGAKPHPGALVQSSAMASVLPPAATYTPNLPKEVIEKGMLSLAQLEVVVYAGQAHAQMLPNGERRGFLIGDGTGVGKGREISGVIIDNFRQGRTKAVWFSEKQGLLKDAQRDFEGVGGNPALISAHTKVKASGKIDLKSGILFSTYDTLRSKEQVKGDEKDKKKPITRLEQVAAWLGPDFDGVIVFDEAHNMGNASPVKGKRGMTKPSQRALAGVDLQRLVPNARILYVSATAATEVPNLTYASRLGLWGEGTAFSKVQDFVAKIGAAGVSAMELVARDMKALGSYIARSLSYDGVTYDRVVHELTSLQSDSYNEVVRAWQVVLKNIHAAMEETGANKDGQAKGAAMAQFWGAHQRFFNQLITAMQMPSVLEAARTDLADGKSVVMQLVNTNEAEQERQVAEKKRKKSAGLDGDEVEEDFEFGPMDGLMNYVRSAFPIQQYEEYTDDEGRTRSRPVVDSAGNPVVSKEAIAMREALLENLTQIASSQAIPGNPIDLIVEAFGSDMVAEITGRKRRFVRQRSAEGDYKIVEQKRGKAAIDADSIGFMDGKKRVLIFSDAGGTGFSFHADNSKKNRQPRSHYLVQPGWRADKAVQGFGRTHRTNQAQPPQYRLVTTDLKAQKRFISSIARRLDQLGALTKGERKAGAQGLFTAADNLESQYARTALTMMFKDLYAGRIPGLDFLDLTDQMGLDNLIDPKTGGLSDTKLPEIPQFLNRLLSLRIDSQGALFDAFAERMDELVQSAIEAGTFDDGMQNLRAQKIAKQSDESVFEDKRTGASTRYVDLELTHPTHFNAWNDISARAKAAGVDFSGYYRNNKTSHVVMVIRRGRRVDGDGREYMKGEQWGVSGARRYVDNVLEMQKEPRATFRKKMTGKAWPEGVRAPFKEVGDDTVYGYDLQQALNAGGEKGVEDYIANEAPKNEQAALRELWAEMEPQLVEKEVTRNVVHFDKLTEAEAKEAWEAERKETKPTYTEHTHLVTGAILPIWDRFPEGQTQVVRAQTTDGERILGRVIPTKDLKTTLRNLGVNATKGLTPEAALSQIMDGQTAILANGWAIKMSRVSNDKRIELVGNMTTGDERLLREQGALMERIGWKNRTFIPTGKDGLDVFKRIIESKPIVEMEEGKDSRMSRGVGTSSSLTEGLRSRDIQAVVADVRRALPGAPPIHIHERISQAPAELVAKIKKVGAEGDVEAAFHEGEIHVFPQNLTSVERAQFVVGHHEIRHYGLRGLLGPKLDAELLKLYASNAGVMQQTKDMLASNKKMSRVEAIEEVLADMPVAELAKLKGFDRFIAAIRRALRALADILRAGGHESLASLIDPKEWTDNDVRALVARAEDMSRRKDAPFRTGGTALSDEGQAPPFYSELARQIEKVNMKAGPAKAWKDYIKSLVSKGVKPDEIEATGINEWLDVMAEDSAIYEPGFGIVEQWRLKSGGEWSQVDDLGYYFPTEAEAKAKMSELTPNAVDDPEYDARLAIKPVDGLDFGKRGAKKVTKEQVMDFLEQNGVRMEDVLLGSVDTKQIDFKKLQRFVDRANDDLDADEDAVAELNAAIKQLKAGDSDAVGILESLGVPFEILEDVGAYTKVDKVDGPAEYTQPNLQQPGGKNYRELLLMLPPAPGDTVSMIGEGVRYENLEDSGLPDADVPGWVYTIKGGHDLYIIDGGPGKFIVQHNDNDRIFSSLNAAEISLTEYAIEHGFLPRQRPSTFTGSHHKRTNVLAHVRFNERTDADGKRVLFLEEVQSDWAQQGRKQGFSGDEKAVPDGIGGWKLVGRDGRDVIGENGMVISADTEAEAREYIRNGIPSAPFVTKTEAWTGLVLKRMIRYAAENGFDKIAWTTGEQQVSRYARGLRQHVDLIEWEKTSEGVHLVGKKYRGPRDAVGAEPSTVVDTKQAETVLSDAIGKTMAERIIKDPNQSGTIEGDNITIDKTGMHGFYNRIVPSVANGILKKLGGGKVGEIKVDQLNDAEERARGDRIFADSGGAGWMKQPGFDITPEMRDKVMAGQALFSRAPSIAGSQTTGNAGDSFTANAVDFARDLLHSDAKMGWWGKSVGTQQHKALTNPSFKPVFDETQAFISDVSKFANEAADEARDLLPRIENFKDFAKKSPTTPEIEQVTQALYAGTLFGRGSPLEGRKWTDEELRTGRANDGPFAIKYFNPLTERQIELYRQTLASTERSLDGMAKSLIQKLARTHGIGFDRDMSLEDVAQVVRDKVDAAIDQQNERIDALNGLIEDPETEFGDEDVRDAHKRLKREIKTAKKQVDELGNLKDAVTDIEQKTTALKDHGYFPAMRFGHFAIHVLQPDQNGQMVQKHFGLYESQTQANLAARDLAKEFPDAQLKRFILSKEQYKLFQGMNVDTLEAFAEHILGENGQPIARDPLVQGFLKAASSERSTMKRHIHRKGTAGFSRDLPRVLASFTVSMARAASSNYHAAEMAKLADAVPDGDVKDEAIKLVKYLQDPQEEAQALRGFLFVQFLGGSIAHGLVNMTQPFMVTAPYLTQYTSIGDVTRKLGEAMTTKPENLTGKIRAAYERAKDEGVVAPQEIHQLRAETGGLPIGRSLALRKLSFLWGSIYAVTEQFNRTSTFLAAYKIATEKGMADPYRFAADAVAETQFIYNKGNRPNWARGPVGATIFTFKQFSISYLELAKRMYDRKGPDGKPDRKAFALLALMLVAAAGIEGAPFAEDIEDLIDTVGQWMGYATKSKKKLRTWAVAVLGPDMAQIALKGISGLPWMPVDVSVRMGLQNLIPGTSMLKPSEKNKARDVLELVGPVGQFVPTEDTQLGRALERLSKGDYFGVLKSGAPVAVQNIAKGADMYARGYAVDGRGKRIADVSPVEAVLKMAGLQPASLARASDKIGSVAQDIAIQRRTEDEIAEKWARGYVDRDEEAVRQAREQLAQWNADNPELRIRVTIAQIARRAREMRLSRDERFIKSAPPEIRGGVREALR